MIALIELDGTFHRLDGDAWAPVDDIGAVNGDKWLLTDFKEAMSRLLTVEGPVKYAELLVRRKLQETGEFEEPVDVITHWKKKRGKNTTDIFFTAVPSRLMRYYFEELREQPDAVLVFPVYAVMWATLRQTRSRHPVAVVLRHDRFAEILVGTKDRVYFANRCVAYDTQEEQIQALWQTIRSDIEAVETENRVTVNQVVALNYPGAAEDPPWPPEWQKRLTPVEPTTLRIDAQYEDIAFPVLRRRPPTRYSASPFAERACFHARRWAPAANLMLLIAAVLLFTGMGFYQKQSRLLEAQTADVQGQIRQIQRQQTHQAAAGNYEEILRFVQQLEQRHCMPSYQQILQELTPEYPTALQLQQFKVEYEADRVVVAISGEIRASFDQAQTDFQNFLQMLVQYGYHIEESRFETQISRSQVSLKLSRTMT